MVHECAVPAPLFCLSFVLLVSLFSRALHYPPQRMRTGRDGGHALTNGILRSVRAVTVCMYAEFARSCYTTARTYALHARGTSQVLVEDLVRCMYRESLHPSGSVAHMRGLLDFIMSHGALPTANDGVIEPEWVARIFTHYDAVMRHMGASCDGSDDDYERLGGMLVACLTTGCAMQRRTDHEDNNCSSQELHTNHSRVITGDRYDDNTSAHDDLHYAGRGHCSCDVCQSVNLSRVAWAHWTPPEQTIESSLKTFVTDFEQRLIAMAEDAAHDRNTTDLPNCDLDPTQTIKLIR